MRNASFFTRFFLAFLCFLSASTLQNAHAQFDKYDLKAHFIHNFAQFTTWPKEAFTDDRAPIVVGVLGSDPIGPRLERLFNSRPIKGRRVEVRRSKRIVDLWGCNIIFICNSEKNRIKDIADYYSGRALEGAGSGGGLSNRHPVLTIADNIDNFCQNGGIINFLGEGLDFEISVTAARRVNLVIYADVLSLAKNLY
jgi:hypothetical protein